MWEIGDGWMGVMLDELLDLRIRIPSLAILLV